MAPSANTWVHGITYGRGYTSESSRMLKRPTVQMLAPNARTAIPLNTHVLPLSLCALRGRHKVVLVGCTAFVQRVRDLLTSVVGDCR